MNLIRLILRFGKFLEIYVGMEHPDLLRVEYLGGLSVSLGGAHPRLIRPGGGGGADPAEVTDKRRNISPLGRAARSMLLRRMKIIVVIRRKVANYGAQPERPLIGSMSSFITGLE